MKIRHLYARRYAEGFLRYAQETIGVKECVQQLEKLENIIRSNPQIIKFLSHQAIDEAEKYRVIDDVLGKDFSSETKSFLKLLVDKNHILDLLEIIDFVRELSSQKDTVNVTLNTAFEWGREEIDALRQKIEKRFQKKALLTVNVTRGLIGGAQIRIGNRLINFSVKQYLWELRERLKSLKVSENVIEA